LSHRRGGTIVPSDVEHLPDGSFGITIESDRSIVAERTIVSTAPDSSDGETAAVATSRTWYVPGAPLGDETVLRYTIFNPVRAPRASPHISDCGRRRRVAVARP
jgi:hypothetical protein